MRLITKAVAYARNWHSGQEYGDETYFDGHLAKVANVVAGLGGSDKLVAVAYLHDILEDTKIPYAELVDTFGIGIASVVLELTRKAEEDYADYFSRVVSSPEARVVKLADSLVNLSKTTQELTEGNATVKTQERIARYSGNIAILSKSIW